MQCFRNVLLDAIVLAGTNPCVTFIKQAIEKKLVQGERAAMLIMALPMTIKTPTSPILRELLVSPYLLLIYTRKTHQN